MTTKDLHNNLFGLVCIAPQTVGTTGTGRTGQAIDRRDYMGVEFFIGYGAITATNAVFTVTVKESDSATAASFTSVADADLLGTEAAAGIAAGTPRTAGSNSAMFKRIGYKGSKRYVRVDVKSTITAATPISVMAGLWSPNLLPVAAQT